jgi:DNA-binding transcriptional MerR regulator
MADRAPDPDDVLAAAVSRDEPSELLTRDELAQRAGLPAAVVEALEREGLVVPASDGLYRSRDADVLSAGQALLQAGIPLGELLVLARRMHAALADLADAAIDLFVRFVRDPVRASAGDEDEAAQRLLEAYSRMLPAAGTLVAEHFESLLVAQAQARTAERRRDTG